MMRDSWPNWFTVGLPQYFLVEPCTVLPRLLSRLTEDVLLLVLLLALLPLWWWSGRAWQELPSLVDWRTVAALAGLMVLSRALEESGYLTAFGQRLIAGAKGQRRLALLLVWLSAALAAVVTNDVALFIVVPLTLSLRAVADLPVGRLVIFEALAVNAGSAVSPMGNPQNLFMWQFWSIGFGDFLLAMLPLAAALMAVLSLLVLFAFPAHALASHPQPASLPRDRSLLWLALLLYPPFLLATDMGYAVAAALIVLGLFLCRFRAVLAGIDWLLLLVFVLMFVDLGLLAGLPALQTLVPTALLAVPGGEFSVGIGLSQVISNVPATLLLAAFTDDWRTLAWAVSVGGFGVAIGSLANLIALRLARQPGLWREFHLWSGIMLVAGWAVAVVLLPS
ncbi:MAG: SLC13 family permease [Alcanivoracaceae bacterium]